MKKKLIIIALLWIHSLGLLIYARHYQITLWACLSLAIGLILIKQLYREDKQNNNWQHLAHRDELTNLLNRRGLLNIDITVPYCLLILDIDSFKFINDTYGHLVGDDILKNLSKQLKKNTRQTDICARWGGDEFIVLLSNGNKKSGELFSQRLQQELTKHQSDLPVFSVSIGLSDSSEHTDIIEIINIADHKLLKKKKLRSSNRHIQSIK